VVVAYRPPGGGLRRHVVRLRRRTDFPPIGVELTPAGRGVLATPAGLTGLAVRSIDRRGRLGRPRTVRALGTRNGYPSDVALAVNPTGAGVLGALVATARGDLERTRAVAWSLSPEGRPQRRRVLSGSWRSFGPQDGVTATIDAVGHGRVAWADDDALFAVRLP
jgi:hypothetical protein